MTTPVPAHSFEIQGVLIPGDRVAYRAMNFGQPIKDRTPFPYALRRPVAEFAQRLREKYEQCVVELREDYDRFGDDEDETTIALAAAGWPTTDEIVVSERGEGRGPWRTN